MWFLGGACLSIFVAPSQVSSTCISSNTLSSLVGVPIIGLFIPFNNWVSLFYWFAPIAGFFFAFFAIKWWNNYFETKEAFSIFFPIILIVFLLLGNYLTISWYYADAVSQPRQGVQYGLYFCFDNSSQSCNETAQKLNEEYIAQFQTTGGNTVKQLISIDYWSMLRKNIFLTFIFGAIAGWIPFFVKNVLDKKSK